MLRAETNILSIVLNDLTAGQVQNCDFTITVKNNGLFIESFLFPPNFNVPLSPGTYSVDVAANPNADSSFKVIKGSNCSSDTSGPISPNRTCLLYITPGQQLITGGGLGENTSVIPERNASR